MPTRIHGAEYPIEKIFCDDFVFSIPLYQRPYAWEIEQAEALLDDLLDFLGDSNTPIDEISPYFLGSIVLIKTDGASQSEVVDGQQRLTTLTILLSVLREVVPEKIAKELTKYIYEEGSWVRNTPNRYRLTLRERDEKFFRDYIQDEGGISKLIEKKDAILPDSQAHIRDNALHLLKRLQKLSEHQCIRLTQFVITGCLLVVVSTPDMDSAYRIFSVLNDRGLDLSHTDILKSEIIGKISPGQQEQYNRLWEDTEVRLGRGTFQDLFSHIRMIYRKAKQKDSVLKEVRLYVEPSKNPAYFIDEVLCPTAQAYADIQDCYYESNQHAEAINTYFKYLNRIDNADWLPPAIAYLSKHRHQPDKLLTFFKDLDRLASGLMIQRADINQRMRRYSTLLTWIEEGQDLSQPDSPLHLTADECQAIIQRLNGPLYLETKIRLYVLLRLDTYLSGGEAVYTLPRITVEHILPQTPRQDSQWLAWFPDEETRQGYVHRLGNLALLSGYKNSSAQNYDFETKKKKYFTGKSGVSPFAMTTQVLNTPEWTPKVIEKRQDELINSFKELWRLDEAVLVPQPALVG
ncbi:DUF262 domain-containing HNH endonuclease family protein [Nodosilinea sp. E11]|uniref:DUF262 domain-containing protein n=1 Tax=Nodosilinea sp. E11 TaxID=3037479 RepID=UPI002934382C|nr:DUF262 domain-containing HNH endonuclease family protein [Nodosilinea sp. E11]WOD37212.1 DUF262 domain-containing HNH endonuclease family protein [Nodosilinea sp. E11]